MRVKATGNVTVNGKKLERGQEIDLPAIHCRAAIRTGHLTEVKAEPKGPDKRQGKRRAQKAD